MFCPNCGNNCNDADVVCGNCGTPLRANPNPGYGAAAPKGAAAEKVKNLGKNIKGNKTVLYAVIGVVALAVLILLCSLIFKNPAGAVAQKYANFMLKGNYEKANKLTYVNYKEYVEDYEKYVKKDMGMKKFDLKDAYEYMKDENEDKYEDEYGKKYKIKNVKTLYVHEWDKDDVEDWIDDHEDGTVRFGKKASNYINFDKIKKMAYVYVSYVVEGKDDGAADVMRITVAKVGGSWKIVGEPNIYANWDKLG